MLLYERIIKYTNLVSPVTVLTVNDRVDNSVKIYIYISKPLKVCPDKSFFLIILIVKNIYKSIYIASYAVLILYTNSTNC